MDVSSEQLMDTNYLPSSGDPSYATYAGVQLQELSSHTHTRDCSLCSTRPCADSQREGIDEDEDVVDEAMFEENTSRFCANQITMDEFRQQATKYTKMAVDNLVSSREYQLIYTRCQLCWCSWSEGQFAPAQSCAECGGFAMTRPCPVCQGHCGATWTRDVELSHSQYKAHWNGDCLLPADRKEEYLAQYLLTNMNDDVELTDCMQDLTAS